MAGRPAKHTVEWFPHEGHASEGKTLTILENHFGADGYMAWYKLLERLSTTDNHIIDCRNGEDIEFIAAKIKLLPERFESIINKMADLEAIDKALWTERKVIWCQHLVDNLKPVYDNRRQKTPQKPMLLLPPTLAQIQNLDPPRSEFPIIGSSNGISDHISGVEIPISTTDNLLEVVEVVEVVDNIYSLFSFWNSKNIIRHGKLDDKIRRSIKSALNSYQESQIRQAIDNYAEIIRDQNKYYFTYRWTLKDFLSRGLDKFMDIDIARHNYVKKGVPNGNRERVPERYTTPEESRQRLSLRSTGETQ
jgi:hypothetical protein